MDPPLRPQPTPPVSAPAAAAAAVVFSSTPTATTNSNPPHLSASNSAAPASTYPDSIDSSPRSRTTDSFLDDPPLLSSKLRLMCSYGGHIVPRPHDKSLCYVGGDTRIVVVDRNISLSSLSSRLSNTLLNGLLFTLKYQLPSEDLDSLISVTTNEDLENMIDEYDRTNSNAANSAKPSRLRLFLFPLKPDSSQSIGPILESSGKSDDWFLNALNGETGLLNRGFSDSASVNCLLGLDDANSLNGNINVDLVGCGVRDVEGLQKNNAKQSQDVHSVPDSPMLETTSSFGSSSSSPSLANLPPIRVHVEDGGGTGVIRGVLPDQKGVGLEEQFAQINVSGGGGGGVGQKQDDDFIVISSPPPMPVSLAISGVPVGSPVVVPADYQNRVYSDDERSDHGVPIDYRKLAPPQSKPQPVVPQTQQKSSSGGAVELPSSDSVSSDNSLSNAINRQKPMIYQDQVMQIPAGVSRVASNPVDPKMKLSDPNPGVQIQQVQDSGLVLQPLYEQQEHQPHQPQQFIHAGAHYIQHHPAGAVPFSAYYHVYSPQQQHQPPHQFDQQYPVYYVQTRQLPQAYNLPMQQSSINEPTPAVPSTHPQTQQNSTMAPPQGIYNPVRNAPIGKPEIANSAMYRTRTAGAPQLVQVSSNQHQQKYVGYSLVHHPSQSGSPVSGVPANYAYEFADPAHAQIYYTQPIPSNYQTSTTAGAVVLPESSQLPNDSIKQQTRTSQPI